MERIDKAIITIPITEVKNIIAKAIVAAHPELDGKTITVDTRNVLQPITALEVHVETAETAVVEEAAK